MIMVECEYDLGDLLYLKTDEEPRQRMVTAISIRQKGIVYELSFGTTASWHGSFEMTTERTEMVNAKL